MSCGGLTSGCCDGHRGGRPEGSSTHAAQFEVLSPPAISNLTLDQETRRTPHDRPQQIPTAGRTRRGSSGRHQSGRTCRPHGLFEKLVAKARRINLVQMIRHERVDKANVLGRQWHVQQFWSLTLCFTRRIWQSLKRNVIESRCDRRTSRAKNDRLGRRPARSRPGVRPIGSGKILLGSGQKFCRAPHVRMRSLSSTSLKSIASCV